MPISSYLWCVMLASLCYFTDLVSPYFVHKEAVEAEFEFEFILLNDT